MRTKIKYVNGLKEIMTCTFSNQFHGSAVQIRRSVLQRIFSCIHARIASDVNSRPSDHKSVAQNS